VAALHFPDAELMPGLVNCHTHLELTHLGGGVQHDEPEFLKWIRRIRELKETTSAEAFARRRWPAFAIAGRAASRALRKRAARAP